MLAAAARLSGTDLAAALTNEKLDRTAAVLWCDKEIAMMINTTIQSRSLRLLLALALLVMSGRFSLASTPSMGTLNPVAGSTASWTGSGVAGATTDETTCVDGMDCDVFSITLTGSPSSYAGFVLAVRISHAVPVNDYDLYVHKGGLTGPVIASSTTGIPETGESVIIDPTVTGTGIYTIHVVDSSVAPGDPIRGTATIILTPNVNHQAGGTAPTYASYASPAGLGDSSGEPSIGANFNSGRIMTQAVFDTLQVSFDTTVSPAVATWRLKDGPNTNITTFDPILFTDSQTGRTIVSQLLGPTSLSAFTDDDGETYTVSQGSGIASGIDHQTVGGGPFRLCTTAELLASPTTCAQLAARGPLTQYPNAVYYASQDSGDAAMALSQDGGLTYEEAHPMYTLVQCGGLHGHIKVSSSGIVYVPNARCSGVQGLIVSMDNGLTFTVQPVTGSTSGTSDPSVGIGAKGRVYFGYTDRNGHARITISDDQGRSWHDDNDVGIPFQIQNAVFPEVIAGDNDRAAFFFLGTPSSGNGSGSDAGTPFNGVWHGYIATTYDGGKTWFTVDATPTDPVQLGVICTQGTTCPAGTRNLLDFNDITVDKNGRVFAAFTDGCVSAACIAKGNNPAASHTKTDNDGATKATIIRQATGEGLFQSGDSTPLQP
ncbi:MAG TPA: sialidase family protein [Candidatus Angelobacter sp.]|nr:sialidase family protein [Candidatus Angelobacter sp.]